MTRSPDESLLQDQEKRAFFTKLGEDFIRLQSDSEQWADYQKEFAAWDVTLLDGLEDESPESDLNDAS